MPTFSIDEAENAELYLLGYPETRSGTTGRRRRGLEPYYSQKMKMMEDMASASWDCKVTKVSFGKNFKPDRVHNYFRTAFASKRPGDAVYVYFNGTGIGKHDEYSWEFDDAPYKLINAYSLIQLFVDSGLNVMLLLDCRVPTRWAEKWGSRDNSNLEIVARGELDSNAEKQIIEDRECDFTENMVNRLETFVDDIGLPSPGYLNYHAATSIPLLMRRNKELCENPKRIFNKRTRAKDTRPVARFCIMPDHVRASEKIKFFLKTIQAEPKEEAVETGHAPVTPEDEGYEEGSDAASDATSDAGGFFMDCS